MKVPDTAGTNVNPLLGDEVPLAAVTVTVWSPSEAAAATVIEIGMAVSVPPLSMFAVTPDPPKVTAVAPVKPRPESVAAVVVP
jgi:hypothetical protein